MMTKKRAQELVKAIINLRDSATDEQAATAAILYPVWQEEQTFAVGSRVVFNNVLYKVLQNHTSQADWTPDVATSLFATVLTSDSGAILAWVQPDSTNPYMSGDKVSHNGETWVSITNNNVWEPGVYGWEVVE